MSTLSLLRAGLLVAASAFPLASPAQITIAVGADEQQAWSDEVTFDKSVTRAWGRAGAALDSAFGQIETGIPGCHLVNCGPFVTLPGASGAARANATQLSVGVRGYGASSHLTQGFGEVEVRDSLLVAAAGILTFDIHLDLELSASAGADARYNFAIALGSGDDKRVEFAFSARDVSGVRTAEVLLDNGNTGFLLPAIPGSYDYILNVPVLPGSIPIEVAASGVAESGSNEFSMVRSFDSAWLGIQANAGNSYASLNGYSYPGFAAAIPEPTQAALLLTGLALVMTGCRCRTRARVRAPDTCT